MEQFSLEKWLQDKSRKVVTRDGRPIRIICTDRKAKSGNIVGLVGTDESGIYVWDNNGKHIVSGNTDNDLFFADESEEELTEFEEEIANILFEREYEGKTETEDDIEDGMEPYRIAAKELSPKLLELVKKEIEPEFEAELDKAYKCADKVQYENGKQDALKDLPKWKKFGVGIAGNCDREVFLIRNNDGTYYTSKVLSSDCVYLELEELEKLPEEK